MVYDFLIVVVFLVLCYISSYHLSGHAWDRQMDSQLSRNESQVKVIPLESPSSCDWQLLQPFRIFSMWLMIAPALSDTRGEKLGSSGWAHLCNAGRGYLPSWKSKLWLCHNISEKEQASLSKMTFILSYSSIKRKDMIFKIALTI